MKSAACIIAVFLGLTASHIFAESKTEAITLRPNPNEVLIKCEKHVPGEPVPGDENMRIVVDTELKVVANRDTGRREVILVIKAKMSGGNLNGTYTGEKIVTLQTFGADVKELELEARASHDHNFDFTEKDWNGKKQFGWTHPGFKQDARKDNSPNRLPMNHIFYEGGANRNLKILLNTEISAKVTVTK